MSVPTISVSGPVLIPSPCSGSLFHSSAVFHHNSTIALHRTYAILRTFYARPSIPLDITVKRAHGTSTQKSDFLLNELQVNNARIAVLRQ